MNFIGIDLSWKVSPVKPLRTAAVVLNESYELIANTLLSTDEDIIEFIGHYKGRNCIVGIDAPLIIPEDVKQRVCERKLLSCGIAVFPGNRDWFERAFGGVRGEILVEKLRALDIPLKDSLKVKEKTNAVMEVYPYSAWKVIFGKEKVPKYKNTARKKKIEGLEILRTRLLSLSPPIGFIGNDGKEHGLNVDISQLSNKELDQFSDFLDAYLASYVILTYWRYGGKRCIVVGDIKKGFILTLTNDCLRKMELKKKRLKV